VSLRLQNVTYRYAGADQPAVHDIELALDPGEVVGVVGANESGKSTLALVAAGLAPAVIGGRLDGVAYIDGLDSREAPPHALAQRCGILFQNPTTQLSGTARTVWEEVSFGPRNLGLPVPEICDRVEWAVRTLRIHDLSARDPGALSGGQAQLVALAGVLAMRPANLVLDEPTSELDPRGTHLVGDALGRLAAETGTALLIVEHNTELLARVCTRIAILASGRLVRSAPASDVLNDHDLLFDLGVEPPPGARLKRRLEEAGLALEEGLLSPPLSSEAEAGGTDGSAAG
jgi:energy-coupling factor transport system ATP-binding protein